jgi:hypothetical protein
MNIAIATYTVFGPRRAVVDIEYKFSDGRENHTGFSTVECNLPSHLYDDCYSRADALAKEQGCRLEKFSVLEKDWRVYFSKLSSYATENFESMEKAVEHAREKCFDAIISKKGHSMGMFSPINGFSKF